MSFEQMKPRSFARLTLSEAEGLRMTFKCNGTIAHNFHSEPEPKNLAFRDD
jgi:hypothetical protein